MFIHCFAYLLIFLLFHPALRIHNFTVLPSHNSTFVYTNDSAYSNFSATVGEDLHFILFCICQAWMVLVSLDSKLTLSFGSVGHVVKIYVFAEIND